jgi:hypothetical protein
MAATIATSRLERRNPVTATVALMFALAAPLLLYWQQHIRNAEAQVAASVMRWSNVRPAHAVGVNVTFPLHGHFVGYNVTLSCTVALLIAPFCLIDAGLMWSRRTSLGQGVRALFVVAIILILVNQLRLLSIGASMVVWGFHTGYERSHVLLGTTLSILGVVLGVIVFIYLLVGDHLLAGPRYDDEDEDYG